MFSKSSLIDSGYNLHVNEMLPSSSILLFYSSAWWKSAGSASLNFFRVPLISPPLVNSHHLGNSQKTSPEPKDDSPTTFV